MIVLTWRDDGGVFLADDEKPHEQAAYAPGSVVARYVAQVEPPPDLDAPTAPGNCDALVEAIESVKYARDACKAAVAEVWSDEAELAILNVIAALTGNQRRLEAALQREAS